MKKESKAKLDLAELFYKFALGISAHIMLIDKPLEYYGQFAFGKHIVDEKELKLNRKQEKMGSAILEDVSTYMMMLQLNEILVDEWGLQSLESKDDEIKSISQVVRLIRNAFAHDPFNPIWRIPNYAKNQEYVIPDVLTLKTHELDGKKFDRMDYGGPLALLRSLQYTRNKLES